jgi:hypothetical protein
MGEVLRVKFFGEPALDFTNSARFAKSHVH